MEGKEAQPTGTSVCCRSRTSRRKSPAQVLVLALGFPRLLYLTDWCRLFTGLLTDVVVHRFFTCGTSGGRRASSCPSPSLHSPPSTWSLTLCWLRSSTPSTVCTPPLTSEWVQSITVFIVKYLDRALLQYRLQTKGFFKCIQFYFFSLLTPYEF